MGQVLQVLLLLMLLPLLLRYIRLCSGRRKKMQLFCFAKIVYLRR